MPFKFLETTLPEVILVEPVRFLDKRGFFLESYQRSVFHANGITDDFVQDNHSCSGKHVLRGLHFQQAPCAQAKLVRVVAGAVWDVAVDIRPGSATLGRWYGAELTAENGRMLYLPAGFAHGFLALADNTHFLYKCSCEYSGAHDAGIRWNDPDIGIKWPGADFLVSDKDAALPFFRETEQS
jgi:dTDP-4-dehydrorhamnose 3,5-epimerase